jgi:phage terminase large subunit-like protein
MRVGAVKFNKEDDWWPDFEEELLRFPRGGHDDQVDALSILGRGLNKFLEAPPMKSLKNKSTKKRSWLSGSTKRAAHKMTGY